MKNESDLRKYIDGEDFELFNAIMSERKNSNDSVLDVLRRKFGLPIDDLEIDLTKAWVSKGVVFPHGTQFRMEYKREIFYGEVADGKFLVDGIEYSSLSPATKHNGIRKNQGNGWKHWECKLPGKKGWVSADKLR